ncbi:hypothetical protein OF83DRAFT_793963 [Amylostereum chailletii]|nr:hypothetical protein OF83DRAFT_793963 [Amylostereum chailletii]
MRLGIDGVPVMSHSCALGGDDISMMCCQSDSCTYNIYIYITSPTAPLASHRHLPRRRCATVVRRASLPPSSHGRRPRLFRNERRARRLEHLYPPSSSIGHTLAGTCDQFAIRMYLCTWVSASMNESRRVARASLPENGMKNIPDRRGSRAGPQGGCTVPAPCPLFAFHKHTVQRGVRAHRSTRYVWASPSNHRTPPSLPAAHPNRTSHRSPTRASRRQAGTCSPPSTQ